MTDIDTILITGGCGFIGTSLIKALLRKKPYISVRVLDNLSTGSEFDLGQVCTFKMSCQSSFPRQDGVVLIKGDIRDVSLIEQCVQGVDCIVHLAANTGVGSSVENPRLDMECNVVGTLNVLEAARLNGVKKFIFASSGAPAGDVKPPIHEELPLHPVSPYGASKLAGEGYCSAYFRTFGIETVCLRFGNVYGPRSNKKTSLVAKFIRQTLSGQFCEIYGDGTQTRDFIYIEDLVRAVLLCMEKDVGGETFQIATGMEHTVSEVANLVARLLKRRGVNMQIKHGQPRLGDVHRNFADTSKAKCLLGWKSEIKLEEGIENTLEYFMDLVH